jgi:hypothetical protein
VQAVPGGVRGPGVHDADHQVGLHVLDVVAEPDEQPQGDAGHECACREEVRLFHGSRQQDERLDDEEENGGKHHDVEDRALRLVSATTTPPPSNLESENSRGYTTGEWKRKTTTENANRCTESETHPWLSKLLFTTVWYRA